jgi:hypothetical protein
VLKFVFVIFDTLYHPDLFYFQLASHVKAGRPNLQAAERKNILLIKT